MAHCEHVPSMPFTPNMSKGYRSDANANAYPQLGPIRFGGICLTDIMQNGSRRIPGAQDEVFGQAPYGIIKLYLTWPGYRGDLISVDLYAAGMRPTRGSIAIEAAKMFCRYIENCRMSGMQPAAAKWRIGAGGLTIHNILFNKLVNTFENVWQIDCDIIV